MMRRCRYAMFMLRALMMLRCALFDGAMLRYAVADGAADDFVFLPLLRRCFHRLLPFDGVLMLECRC